MSGTTPAALVLGLVILVVTVELLRRRQLREKYSAIWLAVAVVAVVLAIWPQLLAAVSDFFGFQVPANFLFLLSGVALLVISMQLSLEVGRLEGETMRLAEEVALLRHELDGIRDDRRRSDGTAGEPRG